LPFLKKNQITKADLTVQGLEGHPLDFLKRHLRTISSYQIDWC